MTFSGFNGHLDITHEILAHLYLPQAIVCTHILEKKNVERFVLAENVKLLLQFTMDISIGNSIRQTF